MTDRENTPETRSTFHDFVDDYALEMTATPIPFNPYKLDEDPRDSMDWWALEIKNADDETFRTFYGTGIGHRHKLSRNEISESNHDAHAAFNTAEKYGWLKLRPADVKKITRRVKPDLADVLCCLQSDARAVEDHPTFRDFAEDFGYELDSRDGEKTYNACQDTGARLRDFFGRDLFREFLNCEEE